MISFYTQSVTIGLYTYRPTHVQLAMETTEHKLACFIAAKDIEPTTMWVTVWISSATRDLMLIQQHKFY